MIQAVFFDAAGTLCRIRERVGATYAKIAARQGLVLEPSILEERFLRAIRSAPPLAFPQIPAAETPVWERRWWREIVQKVLALDEADKRLEPIFSDLFDYFGSEEGWELYPEVPGVLRELQGAGYRTGIISNFDSRLRGILDRLGILKWIDPLVISSTVGVAKPAPKIFFHALETAGIKPEEALHIGNELEADVHGAMAAGMQGWLLDRTGQAPLDTGIKVIHHLGEISGNL